MTETMTVHKALAELKTLSKRIEDEISAAQFVKLNKHSSTKIDGVDVSKYISDTKDKYKSIMTLIWRRNAIKQAVTKSNANTVVQINNEKYTVAEAIDMKKLGIEYFTMLKNHVASQLASAKKIAERQNGANLEERADSYIKATYGVADKKSMSAEIQQSYDSFVASQTVELVDPIGAEKVISELSDSIDKFMTEVDAALSVANALTTIEITYPVA